MKETSLYGTRAVVRSPKRASQHSNMVRSGVFGLDRWLLLGTLALVAVGLVAIFSSSYVEVLRSKETSTLLPYRPLFIQFGWCVLGFILMFVASRCPLPWWRTFAPLLLLINLVLIGLTYIEPFRVELNGAHRWFEIPGVPLLRFQPAELLKLSTVLMFAAWMTPARTRRGRRNYWFWLLFLFWGAGCLLVEQQPDLGTMFLIVLLGFGMAFLGGLAPQVVAGLFFVLAFASVAWVYKEPYRIERFKAYLDPWAHYEGVGYQMARAQLALGSGGLIGVGLGEGREKHYLPAATTDYIFANIAEETGFVGSLVCLLLFAGVIGRCFWITYQGGDRFAQLVAVGIGLWIALQSLMNLAMATGLIPSIGVPLPFISYGGSGLCVLMMAMGLVHRVGQKGGA